MKNSAYLLMDSGAERPALPGAPGHREQSGQPPNFQQFKDGLPGNNGVLGSGTSERQGSDLNSGVIMSPLAANLVRLMEQARQNRIRSGFSEFYPQWWMYNKMLEIVNDYSPFWRSYFQSEEGKRFAQQEGLEPYINLRSEISDEGLEARHQFFSDTATAYGIAAYRQFTPRQKNRFREILRGDIKFNIGNVTLNEQQRDLLTQIATATNTLINPDQAVYHYYTVLMQPEITEKEMEEDPGYNT